MRLFFLLLWLAIPALAWAYHLGPGQLKMRAERIDRTLRAASLASSRNDFRQATKYYSDALAALPSERRSEGDAIRLELAKAQMESGQLPEARALLEELLESQENTAASDLSGQMQTRSALAQSQYLMTWLMRLEGQPAEAWESEIDGARQNYRLLVEQSLASGKSSEAQSYRHDLEASIRLARMDLAELQGLKIPSQCKNCRSNQCKKPGRPAPRKSQNKGAGANEGPLPDELGS